MMIVMDAESNIMYALEKYGEICESNGLDF